KTTSAPPYPFSGSPTSSAPASVAIIAELLELLERQDLRLKESGKTSTALVVLDTKQGEIVGHIDVAGFVTMRVQVPRVSPLALPAPKNDHRRCKILACVGGR